MIKIRLVRLGKKKSPFFRLVAIESGIKLSGKSVANLGYWQPEKNVKNIDKGELTKWISKGAILSEAVKNLISNK